MSCQQGAGRLSRLAARLSAGIAPLASQHSFYAGLGLAGLGVMGAGLLALARRRRDPDQTRPRPRRQMIDVQQVPNLPAPSQIAPSEPTGSDERCAGCGTPATRPPGLWYVIAGRGYCQNCAPAQARQAGVELSLPTSTGPATPTSRGTDSGQANASGRTRAYLSPERRVDTRLEPARIGLNLGSAAEPALYVVEQGYVLLRRDGTDTGLALTPHLTATPGPEGQIEIEEDRGRWWLTHIPSGRALVGQPYDSPQTAQLLGSILAQLDWTRPEAELMPEDYRRASATVTYFNRSLQAAASSPMKADPQPAQSAAPEDTATGSPPQFGPAPLTGTLVADDYGGVARVLEDNGDQLFLIDSLGQRYEIFRHEARSPTAGDFEQCRVARPFDPATQPEADCALCQRLAQAAAPGATWYQMNRQTFCGACATTYAAEEGYLKAEEIDEHLEALS